MIKEILGKENLSYEDIVALLQIDVNSEDFYYLLYKSNQYARTHFSRGYIFTQIGLNTEPCSGNCKFCSMARDNYVSEAKWEMSKEELMARIERTPEYVSDVFLMTTADYDKEQFLDYCAEARKRLPEKTRLIANFADFDLDYANKLKEVGVHGCYHIRRLREGIDTDIDVETRENTIKAIHEANLELYYCIEPIGKEHTYSEIAKEILFAKENSVDVMAVMRRVSVNNNFIEGDINLLEVTKIVAVCMLAVRPKRSMNVHEPNQMSLIAGVNQLYAEEGGNPRDIVTDTSQNRGISVERAKVLLNEANWKV